MKPFQRNQQPPEPTPSCSRPLHVKRIERALDPTLFLRSCEETPSSLLDEDNDEDVSRDALNTYSSKLDVLMKGELW